MITQQVVLTDVALKRAMLDRDIYQLKDPRFSLYARFNASRTSASYLYMHYANNQQRQIKVGSYPTTKPKDMLNQLSSIKAKLAHDSELNHDTNECANKILKLYLSKIKTARKYSKNRRLVIESIIKHMILGVFDDNLKISSINYSLLDSWLCSLQGTYSLSSARSAFQVLKKCLTEAKRLRYINVNPMESMKFSDFSDERVQEKDCSLSAKQLLSVDWSSHPLAMMCVLHGTRLNETRIARWQDISFEQALWTIPASHTKTRREHVIPLTDVALKFLKAHRKHSKGLNIFSGRYCQVMSSSSASGVFRKLSKGKWSAHDVRKRFRSTMTELGVDHFVGESLLNHSLGVLDKTYIHADVTLQKREALNRYHKFLCL